MTANDRQVGGEHYKKKFQHWDFAAILALNYFEGNITKYLSRYREKSGIQDLEKAMHYIEKYMEVMLAGDAAYLAAKPQFRDASIVYAFCTEHNLQHELRRVFVTLCIETWARPSKGNFLSMLNDVQFVIDQLKAEHALRKT